jgi:hypothetical protein
MNAAPAMAEAQALADARLLRSARAIYENTLATARNRVERAFCSFQLGALYWSAIGDGLRARALFRQTFTLCSEGELDSTNTPPLAANSAENLMLLSLSYDEYEQWASQLRRLQPDTPTETMAQACSYLRRRDSLHAEQIRAGDEASGRSPRVS